MSGPVDLVLERLSGAKGNGSGHMARCPAHEDRNPSLSVREGDDGRALISCFAGCSTEAVVGALGLEMKDLFPRSRNGHGWSKESTASWEIRDAEGTLQAIHVRFERDGGKECLWKLPDSGGWGLEGRKLATLPLYRSEHAGEWPQDMPCVVVEGEKAADALARVHPATLGTVTGAQGTPGTEPLEVLRGRRVVLWSDNDAAGRAHMEHVAEALRGVAAEVRIYEWKDAPPKGDAADHPATLGRSHSDVEELLNEMAAAPLMETSSGCIDEGPFKRRTFTAADLLKRDLPPIKWAVPGLVPEGVTLLAGKPKLGKSWMAFGLAVAVATGGVALGAQKVEQGTCLYLALEDNQRRLQKRLRKLIVDDEAPKKLHIATDWPKLDAGGLEYLEEWLKANEDARLIIVDTLAKVRPRSRGQHLYQEDYAAIEGLAGLAGRYGVAIVVVHHLRKMDSDDPLDAVSGTTGLSGGSDGVLILRRDRGRADAYLFVAGREIEEEREMALLWDRNTAGWAVAGDAEQYRIAELRGEIEQVLHNAEGPMTPTEVAEALGKKHNTVKQRMWQMAKDGRLSNEDGRYALKSERVTLVTP